MLTVKCPHCLAQGRAPEKLAGKTLPCPKCKQPLTVPALSEDEMLGVLNVAPTEPKPKPIENPFVDPTPAKRHYDDDDDDAPLRLADERPTEASLWPLAKPQTSRSDASAFERDPDGSFEPAAKPKKRKKKKRKATRDWSAHDPRKEARMWFFALTLLPLLFFTVFPAPSIMERILAAQDELESAENAAAKEGAPKPVFADDEEADLANVDHRSVLRHLPDGKLPGAHLSVDSYVHWLYALLASLFFLGGVAILFPTGDAKPGHLIAVGAATGTIGILALIVFQWIALAARGWVVFGASILVLIFWIIQFISWSYLAGYMTDGPFMVQWLGFTFGVGLCEEFVKAFPVLCLIWSARRSLDWRSMRAWGLASGVGFGISEAIHYCGEFYNGVSGGDAYLIRFFTCVGFHALLTAGSALLLFNNADEVSDREWYGVLGNVVFYLMPAMLMHGLYNTLVTRDMVLAAFFVGVASFVWVIWLSGRTQSGAD